MTQGNHSTPSQKVWLITGAASGLGASLVGVVLARGDKVIATTRPSSLPKLHSVIAALAPPEDRVRVLQLDITDSPEAIIETARQAALCWGRIDVLVNNAGEPIAGLIEELGAEPWVRQFQQVFGTVNVTNAVLPYMRAQREGTIVIIGSRSAWKNDFPGVALYSSYKAALHSYADTLASEIEPFNIRVLAVAPAAFRTPSFVPPKPAGTPIADYAPVRAAGAARFRDRMLENPNLCDPRKGMEIIADVVRGEGCAQGKPWPRLLFLGKEADTHIREKISRWEKDLDEWKEIGEDVAEDKM